MSKTSETSNQNTSHSKSTDAPKKSGCCGGDHDTDKKVPSVEIAQAVASDKHKHEPEHHSHGGSCGCGSDNAKK
jgi:hypothetical protein